ncbi:MAG: YcaO-like family protein [Rhodobacteraceae bacterium]|nr:YcaO-like family protein [Paracoccaceae bacterium]
MTKNNLQNRWQQHDWQTSPYAPRLKIVQALVDGKTASGAGFSRYDALSRCLGETAEIITLSEGESSEGLAAGPDFAFAAKQALSERLERWALWGWWHGQHKAQPVIADELISALRQSAVVPRATSVWHLTGFPHIQVAIALSRSSAGTQPILGFGANICPIKAAQSALIELGLMELNLQAPRDDLQAYFSRVQEKAERLFPAATPRALLPAPQGASIEDRLRHAEVNFSLHDRTPTGIDIVVVKAQINAAPSWAGTSGPLL